MTKALSMNSLTDEKIFEDKTTREDDNYYLEPIQSLPTINNDDVSIIQETVISNNNHDNKYSNSVCVKPKLRLISANSNGDNESFKSCMSDEEDYIEMPSPIRQSYNNDRKKKNSYVTKTNDNYSNNLSNLINEMEINEQLDDNDTVRVNYVNVDQSNQHELVINKELDVIVNYDPKNRRISYDYEYADIDYLQEQLQIQRELNSVVNKGGQVQDRNSISENDLIEFADELDNTDDMFYSDEDTSNINRFNDYLFKRGMTMDDANSIYSSVDYSSKRNVRFVEDGEQDGPTYYSKEAEIDNDDDYEEPFNTYKMPVIRKRNIRYEDREKGQREELQRSTYYSKEEEIDDDDVPPKTIQMPIVKKRNIRYEDKEEGQREELQKSPYYSKEAEIDDDDGPPKTIKMPIVRKRNIRYEHREVEEREESTYYSKEAEMDDDDVPPNTIKMPIIRKRNFQFEDREREGREASQESTYYNNELENDVIEMDDDSNNEEELSKTPINKWDRNKRLTSDEILQMNTNGRQRNENTSSNKEYNRLSIESGSSILRTTDEDYIETTRSEIDYLIDRHFDFTENNDEELNGEVREEIYENINFVCDNEPIYMNVSNNRLSDEQNQIVDVTLKENVPINVGKERDKIHANSSPIEYVQYPLETKETMNVNNDEMYVNVSKTPLITHEVIVRKLRNSLVNDDEKVAILNELITIKNEINRIQSEIEASKGDERQIYLSCLFKKLRNLTAYDLQNSDEDLLDVQRDVLLQIQNCIKQLNR